MNNKKIKVCLCGSMSKFKMEIREVSRRETLAGKEVWAPVELPDDFVLQGEAKLELRQEHFKKIQEADEILVVDVRSSDEKSYIGEDTKLEIEYADSLGKRIRYLSTERLH